MGPTNRVFDQIREQLRLSKEGIWLSNGEEITHEATIRAFFKFLSRSPDGRWSIKIGNEEKPVVLDDTPSFVQSITGSPEKGYLIHLLHDEAERREPLRPDTLGYTPGRLVCRTARGWEARFLRAPYHEILKPIKKDSQGYFLEISGTRIRLQGGP